MAQGTTLPGKKKVLYFRLINEYYVLYLLLIIGDTLIITAFISYVGCFTKQFRLDLLNKLWLPYLRALEV